MANTHSLKGVELPQLTLSSLPSFPASTSIPYHLSFLLLSPPTPIANDKDNAYLASLPSASQIGLFLVRELWTKARGASQTVKQTLGRVVQDVGARV